jgi:hypothetical protein
MNRYLTKSRIAAVVMICMLVTVSFASAETPVYGGSPSGDPFETPTAAGMAADLVLVRVFGLAAIVTGSVLLVVSLPFTIPSKSVNTAAKKLVVGPTKFTFVRPLGEF